MKQPHRPRQPYPLFPPREPVEFYPAIYAPRKGLYYGEDDSFTLATILENTAGIDPKSVSFSQNGSSLTIEWPDPDAKPQKNPRYADELKRYNKEMVKYMAAKEKYDADLIVYEEKKKQYEKDEKEYKIWFYEKELGRLRG
jgi:hypothetical protein